MRLQKFIAQSGFASRRKAEELIALGKVQVNGETITQMGFKVTSSDVIKIQGKQIFLEDTKAYILYNKPIGEISSTHDPQGRKTVMDHFESYPQRLFPIGRLDYLSEGLLLLTNDGQLTYRLLHPSFEVKKVYIASVTDKFTRDKAQILKNGVLIDGVKTAPAKVKILSSTVQATNIEITIHEGRKRQVRRMVEAVGHRVLSLKRVEFGPIHLGNLPSGKWRHLTKKEIEDLYNL